jgi:hypothetical protein
LIVKRSRISGLIEKLTNERVALVARLEHMDGLLPKLHRQLQSLDDTFGLHAIQIEPTEIAPIRPQEKAKILPLGQMSRILLKVMRLQGSWVTTSVLIRAVLGVVPDDGPEFDERYINRAVRRLKELANVVSLLADNGRMQVPPDIYDQAALHAFLA